MFSVLGAQTLSIVETRKVNTKRSSAGDFAEACRVRFGSIDESAPA
jgi:hypothetical protein